MNIELTGAETADDLIKQLVFLRLYGRQVIMAVDAQRVLRDRASRRRDNAPDPVTQAEALTALAKIDEADLLLRSAEIEIGQYLMPLCHALDQKATRQQVFEAINTNIADRDTEDVRKYGDKAITLICVLHLENSAMNRHEDSACRDSQPLQWCHTMAFMRELRTNAKLDRIVHDGANQFFGGLFGEFRDRPLMERLAGQSL